MAIQKAALLRQIARLTASQCTQLGVKGPYRGPRSGVEAAKAIEAWLGDGVLYDAEGNEISLGDMESMFATEGDPMELTLHAGAPMAAEAEEAPAEEPAAAPAEAPAAASIRSMIRQEMASRSMPAVPRVVASTTKSRTTKWFNTDEDKKYAGHWLNAKFWKSETSQKWLNDYAGGYGMKTTQIEGGVDGTLGGYTVPDPLEAAIIEARQEFGVARRICRVFQTSSDSDKIPTKTALPTVYYPGEATAITESNATYGQVSATIVKRAVLVKYSSELFADSVIAIADDLAENAGRVLGIREDNEFLNGADNADWGGVAGLDYTSHTAVTGGATWAALTLANFATVVGTLGDKYHAGASWIMSRSFFGQVVLRVLAAAGGNTFESIAAGATGGGMLLGYPIHFSDQAKTSSAVSQENCYFGDWRSGSVFADRAGIQMATSEHLGFAEDEIAIRVTARYDIINHDGSAFISLDTAAS